METNFAPTVTHRQEPCRVCGDTQAELVSVIDYWDLQSGNLVECLTCHHSQLDPMITNDNMNLGCHAYYIKECIEIPAEKQKRNLVRSFRRGVSFAFSLKIKGIHPSEILEFGPGSGYFSQGVKFVFPNAQVTVVDIVDQVLKNNQSNHGYSTIKSMADEPIQCDQRFDLIIARDIIEHVGDVSKMIANIGALLKVGGYFHFITPNGREDYWGHKMNHKLSRSPSELLINHVNYFNGDSLKQLLEKNNLKKIEYYTYQFKNFLKGKGWKKTTKWSSASTKQSHQQLIQNSHASESDFKKDNVLSEWYISYKFPWLTILYCLQKHFLFLRVNPSFPYGHEIHGLFQKTSA